MGMNLDGPIYLQREALLTPSKNRVLDIGPQTIYNATRDQVREFVDNQGGATDPSTLQADIDRLVYFSTPRPDERTTTLSDVADLTNIEYTSIELHPGSKTSEVLDLNYDPLPLRMRRLFDVVFNFGTSEHIVNQFNCFEMIHDALKVGGVVYHQLPANGYLNYAYFCYTPLFFQEMAQANDYQIKQMAVTFAGEDRIEDLGVKLMAGETLLTALSPMDSKNRIPSLNIHVVMRKMRDSAFQAPLKIPSAPRKATALSNSELLQLLYPGWKYSGLR